MQEKQHRPCFTSALYEFLISFTQIEIEIIASFVPHNLCMPVSRHSTIVGRAIYNLALSGLVIIVVSVN